MTEAADVAMLQSRRDGMRQKAEAVVEFADKRIAHMDPRCERIDLAYSDLGSRPGGVSVLTSNEMPICAST